MAGDETPRCFTTLLEGQQLFYTLLDQGTIFDDAMAALEKHFVPKVNVLACRHTFRQRIQWMDETTSQYVAAVKALAAQWRVS